MKEFKVGEVYIQFIHNTIIKITKVESDQINFKVIGGEKDFGAPHFGKNSPYARGLKRLKGYETPLGRILYEI